jgi:hypothetical protein
VPGNKSGMQSVRRHNRDSNATTHTTEWWSEEGFSNSPRTYHYKLMAAG